MLDRVTPLRILALAAFLSVASAAQTASACSCAVSEPADALRAATAVFEGEIVRAVPIPDRDGRLRAEVRVSRVWKGAVGRTVHVEVAAQPSMCPPHLEVGTRYILYASGPVGGLRIATCARYASPAQLAAERRALGAPIRTF